MISSQNFKQNLPGNRPVRLCRLFGVAADGGALVTRRRDQARNFHETEHLEYIQLRQSKSATRFEWLLPQSPGMVN